MNQLEKFLTKKYERAFEKELKEAGIRISVYKREVKGTFDPEKMIILNSKGKRIISLYNCEINFTNYHSNVFFSGYKDSGLEDYVNCLYNFKKDIFVVQDEISPANIFSFSNEEVFRLFYKGDELFVGKFGIDKVNFKVKSVCQLAEENDKVAIFRLLDGECLIFCKDQFGVCDLIFAEDYKKFELKNGKFVYSILVHDNEAFYCFSEDDKYYGFINEDGVFSRQGGYIGLFFDKFEFDPDKEEFKTFVNLFNTPRECRVNSKGELLFGPEFQVTPWHKGLSFFKIDRECFLVNLKDLTVSRNVIDEIVEDFKKREYNGICEDLAVVRILSSKVYIKTDGSLLNYIE